MTLIPGKWYTYVTESGYWGKFEKYTGEKTQGHNSIWVSEYITNGRLYCKTSGNAGVYENTRECTQEELNSLLPEGHPDRTPPELKFEFI